MARLAAIALVVGVTAPSAAHASHVETILAIETASVALSATSAIAAIITGLGSSRAVAAGQLRHTWFIAAYIVSGVNLALGVASIALAVEYVPQLDPLFAVGAAHALLAGWNVVVPSVGFALGEAAVTPVALQGIDAAGRRWVGAGVRLAGF